MVVDSDGAHRGSVTLVPGTSASLLNMRGKLVASLGHVIRPRKRLYQA